MLKGEGFVLNSCIEDNFVKYNVSKGVVVVFVFVNVIFEVKG